MRRRDLQWDGCLNVRDLGGHRTEDGGETSFRSVVRADSVRQLTDGGWRALVDYGIRTVVDLRGDHERDDDPPAELPVHVLHVPFMEANEREWDEIVEEMERVKAQAPSAAERTRDFYLLVLEHFQRNVAASVRAVARAPEGGVVVHCVGGKDRTGLLSALLLHLAGVDTEQIAADYAVSEERLRPRHEAWLAAAETQAEKEEIRQLSQTPAEVIVGVFEELQSRYGSVEEYLRAAGLDNRDLTAARARLCGLS